MAMTDTDSGTIVLPKRISLAIAAALAAQLGWLIFNYATTQAATIGRIERLERDGIRDGVTLGDIHGRAIRMEEQIKYIRAALERMERH
jgi:hypothetical protein